MNHLLRLAVFDSESGAQRFMTAHDLRQRRTQRREVEFAGETHGERNVVGRRAGIELMNEPQSLLRVREWQRLVSRNAFDGRSNESARLLQSKVDTLGQAGHRRRLKQLSQRNLN